MWAPGTVVANRYRVERLLKEGGMGAVFAARHLVTGRAVALKAMRPSLVGSAKMTAKFFEEARTSARIPSAHVAPVEDVDVDPTSGTPWAVMELLDGEDLDTRCQRALRERPRGRAAPWWTVGHFVERGVLSTASLPWNGA